MHHNFTDDQIEQAVLEAAKKRAGFSVYQMVDSALHNMNLGEINDLRAFLSALPELDLSYPKIPIEDVRKGDRVRITTSMGNQYEVTVDRMDSYTWRWNGGSVYINAIESVHLIERPVNHPDPVEHPAIVVIEADEDTFTGPDILVWTGLYYENKDFGFSPDTITKWQPIDPAKVVADDD